MGGKVARVDKFGDHRLRMRWHALQILAHDAAQAVDQCRRREQITKAQRRKQRFAESADIDHQPGGVDALERRWGPPTEEELSVVVVLDHPGAGLLGRVQQRESTLQAHDAAHRLLVRRGHKSEPELRAQPKTFVDPQAVGVHRHGNQISATGDQAVARADRARVLEPHLVARVEQGRANQMKSLLRAADDEQLLGIAADAAVRSQVPRQRTAQLGRTVWVAVAHDLVAPAAPILGAKAGPLRQRKHIECRQGGGEGARQMRQPLAVAKTAHRLRHQARQFRCQPDHRRHVGFRRLGAARAQHRTDESA